MQLKQKLFNGIIIGGALLFASQYAQPGHSASLTSVTATLSNPRLSFMAKIATGASNTIVPIKTSGTEAASLSVDQLQEGDEVALGGGPLSAWNANYIVAETDHAAGTFSTTANISAGLTDENDHAIATQSSNLTVAFTTANAVAGDGSTTQGHFRILVPARSNSAGTGNDGIPDSGYFDFKTLNTGSDTQQSATVTCPADVGNYDFDVSGTAIAGETYDGNFYHSFTCDYTGAGSIGQAISGFVINNLNNPTAATGHNSGVADTYTIIVQQMDGNTMVDQTAVSVGVIEAVKITAEVPPQISFSINDVTSTQLHGWNLCALNGSDAVTTTNTAVPFGELTISAFKTAAQQLSVQTNANSYVVTGIENDQLGRNGGTCTGDPTDPITPDCIIDSRGDGASMTHTAQDDWSNIATPGFAYTLHEFAAGATSAATPAFTYGTTTGGCDASGDDCFRQFPDAEGAQSPESLFTGTVTNTDTVNVCYKILVQADQPAGLYSNYVTYRATATF